MYIYRMPRLAAPSVLGLPPVNILCVPVCVCVSDLRVRSLRASAWPVQTFLQLLLAVQAEKFVGNFCNRGARNPVHQSAMRKNCHDQTRDAKPPVITKRLKAGASPAAGMAAAADGAPEMRVRLASLLSRYSCRRLWGVVHDAHRQVGDLATKRSTAGAPWRGLRDPRVRLQACGLAMRVLTGLREVHDDCGSGTHSSGVKTRSAFSSGPICDVIQWLAPASAQEQDKAVAQLAIVAVYLSSKLADNSTVSPPRVYVRMIPDLIRASNTHSRGRGTQEAQSYPHGKAETGDADFSCSTPPLRPSFCAALPAELYDVLRRPCTKP